MKKWFSERNGYKPVREVIQRESMDDALRNGLWDCCRNPSDYINRIPGNLNDYVMVKTQLQHNIWKFHFKKPLDDLPTDSYNHLYTNQSPWDIFWKEYFSSCKWYEVYDLIELIIVTLPNRESELFAKECNQALKDELSAYRIVNSHVVEITSEHEIASIEAAIENSPDVVGAHLDQALVHMSDRVSPDYRNSIKESITAVEAICQIISGDKDASLGRALKKVKSKITINEELADGFQKFYNYTNSSDGIRHALKEEPNLDIEDARYMLASCAAFVNYLIVKADKAGIPLK